MPERILCDEGVRVSVSGSGARALLVVAKDNRSLRVWADVAELEEALRGQPVQVSAHGGFCSISVRAERAYLEFGLDGLGRKTCEFPASDLADALKMVRSQPALGPAI